MNKHPVLPGLRQWFKAIVFVALAWAGVLTIATVASAAPAQGDSELSELLAAIGPGNPVQALLQQLAREGGNETLYCMCAEGLYNAGKRESAIALLKIGQKKAAKPQRVSRALRAIYRHELDLEHLEMSYAQELDQAIEAGQQHLPESLEADAVMVQRLRPKYLDRYKKMAHYKGLFEFLRKICKEPDVREQLFRIRLAAVPSDDGTASELLHLLTEQRQWKLLAEGASQLPPPIRKHVHFAFSKARALYELGKKDEALTATDEAAGQLASYKWTWQQVAEMYSKLGKTPRALEIVRTFAPPADHGTAQALATYGDPEGVKVCVQQCIDRDAPAWVLFQCVDACRQAGLAKRAEEVFDLAEARCFRELARDHQPAFSLPHEIWYRYRLEGRTARLVDKFSQAFAGRDKEIAKMLEAACGDLRLGKRNEAVELAGLYYRDNPGKPEFMLVYADMLEAADRRDEAGNIYRLASAMPLADGGYGTPLSTLRMRHAYRVQAMAAATQPATAAAPPPPPASQDSVAELEGLVKQTPKDGSLHVRLGLALMKIGKIEDARGEVRRGLELGYDPKLLPPFHELENCHAGVHFGQPDYGSVASTYMQAGLRAALEEDFKAILSRTNAHRAAHLRVVQRWLVAQSRGPEAAATALQIKSLDPYQRD
ncbi:MAG: hypothetical protein ABFD92_20645 [Planctomycetaceae bacterium]|nr:hypothetical protein [Planctomycetaceae bacterium]